MPWRNHRPSRTIPSRSSAAARPASSISWYLAQARHRSCGAGEGARRTRLARRALGHVLPGDAELAVPACRASPIAAPDPHGLHAARTRSSTTSTRFVASFDPPLREGVAVQRRRAATRSAASCSTTTDGRCTADQVVVAAGGYHMPIVPRCAERLPGDIAAAPFLGTIATRQRFPTARCWWWAPGHPAARSRKTCTSPAARCICASAMRRAVARLYRGKDVVEWLAHMGYYDMPVHEHPLREGVRDKTNHYVTGRDGGRDIDLRKLALEGMQLYGRLLDVVGDRPAVRRRPCAVPRPGRPGLQRASRPASTSFIAKQRHRGAAGAPLSAGLGAGRGAAPRSTMARPASPRSSGASDSARLPLDRFAGVQRARPPDARARRHRRCRACTSSACPGSTPGARAGSPAWRGTRSIWPSTSRPGSDWRRQSGRPR